MAEDSRRRVATIAQYLLGVALLAWLVQSVEWRQTAALARQVDATSMLAVVAASVASVGLLAVLWRPLVPPTPEARYANLLRVDLSVKFANVLLPSRIGGRAAAPLILRRIVDLEWPDAVAVTGLHTGLYALCYGAVSLVGLALVARQVGRGLVLLLAFSTLLYLVAGVAILLVGLRADRLLTGLAPTVPEWELPGVVRRVFDAVRSLGSSVEGSSALFRRQLFDPTAVSRFAALWLLAVVILPGIRFWLLLDALAGTAVALLPVMLYVFTAYSVTVLPLTPGGIGVTEASSTLVFVALGFPEAAVVPALFLDRVIGVYAPSIAGWLPAVRIDLHDRDPAKEKG